MLQHVWICSFEKYIPASLDYCVYAHTALKRAAPPLSYKIAAPPLSYKTAATCFDMDVTSF